MQLNTYVNYGGNCAEAFKFYEQHLGEKIEKTFFAERFAMLRDRFGTSWMIAHPKQVSGTNVATASE